LLAAWRNHPATELADAIDELSNRITFQMFASIADARAKAVRKRLVKAFAEFVHLPLADPR
jgi:hypothetical protein